MRAFKQFLYGMLTGAALLAAGWQINIWALEVIHHFEDVRVARAKVLDGVPELHDSKNVCERTYSEGTVKNGEPEIYQIHVNTTAHKVCKDVSDAFELGQDLECDNLDNGKDPGETQHVDMHKGHYICVKDARYIGPPINPKAITAGTTAVLVSNPENRGDFCFDLYEITER